jgi:hypothetical protein
MTRAKKEGGRGAALFGRVNLFSCICGRGASASTVVCAVPAAAFEYYLWGRENTLNSVVTLWTGNIGKVCLKGHMFFKSHPTFTTGKFIQRHGRFLLLRFDRDGLRLDLFGLWQGNGQHAILTFCLGPVSLDVGWEHHTAFK